MWRLLTIYAFALCEIFGGVAAQQPSRPAEERLNVNIPAAVRAKYRGIQDPRDWLNPIITIRAEGIEVGRRGTPSRLKTVPASELKTFLVSLPVSAWPYGRVVLGSDIGIREGDESDDQPIRRNHDAAEQVLKALDVEIDWWPSA
jgi:hypothetical protein